MEELGNHCDEFLVHAVDVEGKANGIETELADLLSDYTQRPVTYAGGVGSMEDLKLLKKAWKRSFGCYRWQRIGSFWRNDSV